MESGSFSYLRNSVCNTYGIPRNSAEFRLNFTVKIPRNSPEFRVFFKKFRILPEVKKALPWTPYKKGRKKNYLLSNMRRATMVRTSCEEGSVGFLHLPNTGTRLNIVVERGLIESRTKPDVLPNPDSEPGPNFS